MKPHGIAVTLYERTETGLDGFGRPVYREAPVVVDNVLVAPTLVTPLSASENNTVTELDGKTAVYTIAIPKGDTHSWKDCRVSFFGEDWQVIGLPQRGIESLIPLDWNEKWGVARYE